MLDVFFLLLIGIRINYYNHMHGKSGFDAKIRLKRQDFVDQIEQLVDEKLADLRSHDVPV